MKAVIETGGKQYYVTEGTVLYVEKLDAEAGKEVELDKVLMVNDKVGNPYVNGAKVVCEVVKHGKNIYHLLSDLPIKYNNGYRFTKASGIT